MTRVEAVEGEGVQALVANINERIAAIEAAGGDVLAVQVIAVPTALVGEEARRYGPVITVWTAWITHEVGRDGVG